MKRFALALLVLIFAAPVVAQAEPATIKSAGVTLDIPAGWISETPDADSLVVRTEDKQVSYSFTVVRDDMSVEIKALWGNEEYYFRRALWGQAEKYLKKFIPDIEQIGKFEEGDFALMRAKIGNAQGTVEGERVRVFILFVEVPNGKTLMINGIVTEATGGKYVEAVRTMMRSVRGTK